MASRRGRHYHGIKAHTQGVHRKRPSVNGWKARNKEIARARRLLRQEEMQKTMAVAV